MKKTSLNPVLLLFFIASFFTGKESAAYTKSENSKLLKIQAAKEIFVSPQGNDSNPGTREKPLFSVQKALENIAAGETVVLLQGIYKLEKSVTFTCNGTKEAWITLRGEKGAQAILDGKDYNIDNTRNYPHNKGLIQIEKAQYIRIQNVYVRS